MKLLEPENVMSLPDKTGIRIWLCSYTSLSMIILISDELFSHYLSLYIQ